MKSEVAVFNPKLPAHLRSAELSDVAKALMGSGVGGKRVSIKGGVFRLIVNGKEVGKVDERHLDVVIVAAAPKVSRQYYAKEFNEEDAPTAPDCWSPDGDAPDASVKNPQSDRCITCPMNAKGSGKNDSRACRYQQRIAVVLANDMEGDVLQLALPATSLFGKEEGDNRPLQAYARWLAAQNISPDALITRMRFDTDVANPKLFFKPVRWLDEEEYAICKKQGASHDAQQAITFTVAAQDGVKATDKEAKETFESPKEALPKPKAKAKPKADPEPEAEDEPVVRKEEQPAAAKKSNIAAIVDDWDDED